MKSIITIILAMLSFGCRDGGFTARQRARINGQGAMRVMVVGSRRDSLLLRRTSRELREDHLRSPYFAMLKERMLSTVTDPSQQGVGIAAPQVGVSLALVAVQRFDREGEPFGFYVNPRLTEVSQSMVDSPEGCLSVPGREGTIRRHEWIVVEYLDADTFEKKSERIEGFTAIIFQHETDHLHGRLYTDLLTGGE